MSIRGKEGNHGKNQKVKDGVKCEKQNAMIMRGLH